MRVPVIAGAFPKNKAERDSYLEVSTRMTHDDDEAVAMSKFVEDVLSSLITLHRFPTRSELLSMADYYSGHEITSRYAGILANGLHLDLDDFLSTIESGNGVTGYIMTSGAFALYVIARSRCCSEAFSTVVAAGGDTDTIGAVVGAGMEAFFPGSSASGVDGRSFPSVEESTRFSYSGTLVRNILATAAIFIAHLPARLFWRVRSMAD